MILCVESHLGDTFLTGKHRPRRILEQELAQVENRYDRTADNFIPLLCRMYGWETCRSRETPDVTYDRDTRLLLPLRD